MLLFYSLASTLPAIVVPVVSLTKTVIESVGVFPEETVEHTVELPKISDAMNFMCRQSNVYDVYCCGTTQSDGCSPLSSMTVFDCNM